ncbi:Ubiquinone/menaquinone biosynthesis C-methylase UbiE [Duganella sp. CF458]|uniref:class I SAM-dependent methyltransferase n=1 Tax=Duganella sp. CF458 TaxID=1884368 RepID=UPI0008E545FD|nr:class I SAM-dependent methyltransferase [Duganella sp. CF458]SFF95337.1 Ubiquinone/menaquinone biosynthesis C-methylase UbiE [Duganella sp. CF458]
MDWNDGYVADLDYPAAYFAEQSPCHLSIACILNGVEPVPTDRPFTYFELGAGMGLTSNILAASHPHGRFYSNDFNPAHVAAARQLADEAQLENMTVLESSFADLAAGKVDLPPLDYITMYGIYSWITPANRQYLVEFIGRYLKPGGIVYVNYNALPGWTRTLPLQRLLLEHANCNPVPRVAQLEQARELARKLSEAGAAFFDGSKQLDYRMASLARDKAGYLAHEYLNSGWEPLYHADVAGNLAAAGLDFVGSADLPLAFEGDYLTAQQQALLAGIAEPRWRETMRDYLLNTSFREDVYVRGARSMGEERRAGWLARLGMVLTSVVETVPAPDPAADDDSVALREILDALATGPKTLAELARLRCVSLQAIARLAARLAAADKIAFFFLGSEAVDPAPAMRLNRAIAAQSTLGDHYQALASPRLGGGLHSGLAQRLVYQCMAQAAPDAKPDAHDVSRRVASLLQGHFATCIPGSPAEAALHQLREGLPHTVAAILAYRLPIWRTLCML